MSIAYFDCASGVSGDMLLGALVDAGLPLSDLQSDIDRLGIGARLSASRVDRCGVGATLVSVDIDGEAMTPEREQHMAADAHSHAHEHGDQHDHDHAGHDHSHSHDHGHTRLSDILSVIDAADLPVDVKETASGVFRRLTEAEAEVHGADVDEVGLHEVGSRDAIVDIVGVVAGLRRLGVTRVLCGPLHVGTGTVQCAHGRYPLPVPGVVALCRGVPLVQTEIASELVTPTGAALMTSLAERFGAAPAMRLTGAGYGAGGRNHPTTPNVVRVRLGEEEAAAPADACVLLEANLDDTTPEILGYLFERLLHHGALDVWVTPIVMKKNRPGHLLSLLATPAQSEKLAAVVLAETTSLGVRRHPVERRILERSWRSVETPWGSVRVKLAHVDGGRRAAPEYEDCARLAREHDIPLQTLYEAARAAAREIDE